MTKQAVDFFDIKGDVEALLAHTLDNRYYFLPDTHPALAPGQTAAIMRGDVKVGWIGALHPMIANRLDIKLPVYLFELKLANLLTRALPVYQPLSKFPAIRRDLAVLVDASVPADALLQVAQEKAGPLLKQIQIFDVYQGERIEKSKKSIALGLILQDSSRTLIDEEVNELMQAVVQGLEQAFQATVRE
jgi:phenylalanyl-tRNA synthetase beta chain